MRRLLTTLFITGACSASVTFPVSGNGYTLSLIAADQIRIDTPLSDPVVFKSIADVDYFESILIGTANRAGFLGKRTSTGRWFVTVVPIYQAGTVSGGGGTPFGFDETSNIIDVPAFTYHIDQAVPPVLFERDGFLWARSLFHANNGIDPDLVIEANTRAIISETPEPAGLGLLGVGLGALLLRRRRV